MNAGEIKKLRYKFILIATVSILLVMIFIGSAINIISYAVATKAIKQRLSGLIMAETMQGEDLTSRYGDSPSSPSFSDAFSPGFDQNRFFVVSFNDEEEELMEGFRTNSTDEDEIESAKGFAEDVRSSARSFGRYGTLYYMKSTEDGVTTVALLDCRSELGNMLRILAATFFTCTVTFFITLVLIIALSKKMIKPEIENAERQRQFITNASHELKTPLAVIRANTELLELTCGENEWTASTISQIEHMNGLIQNLVLIAKAEEREDKSELSDIDAAKCIRDAVEPFRAVAANKGLTLCEDVEDGVTVSADEGKIRQLATILVDNAMKYCDEGGEVSVSLRALKKGGRGIRLAVSNTFKDGEGVDCDKFFDRFYREDKSHNIDNGGYGIGLSIAETVCRGYGGTIRASWSDGVMTFTCQIS